MTQKEALLAFLRKNKKGITTYSAFEFLGISCVHKRVSDLEADGYKIDRQSIDGLNRYGNPCRVTRYRLANETNA